MKLKISPTAFAEMQKHAEATYPNECCGFFYGKDGEIRNIEVAKIVTNSKEGDQRRRFEVSPLDYLKAERYADEIGQTLLGIYHSHPEHPAIPSEHDLKQAVPFFSYIIISVMKGKTEVTKSWQLDDAGKFEEEEIL
ncbi:MAG: M67 family metallopeptidase [Flammeovirgaceae bacterium]|nr:M67 family metallopeptidase [Flammeovirgaceae bacterium]